LFKHFKIEDGLAVELKGSVGRQRDPPSSWSFKFFTTIRWKETWWWGL